MRQRRRRSTGCVEQLEPRQMLMAAPIISEFAAANGGDLRDAFGESSDWIELHNPDGNELDLGGYHLTDDADDLDKWTFPAGTRLSSGEHQIVFASGRDLLDANGVLHTNFRLDADSGYLALVAPDGMVLTEYGPDGQDYPPQLEGTTYGKGASAQDVTFVAANSPAQILLPSSNSLGDAWTKTDFVADENWQTVTNGIGYRKQDEPQPAGDGTPILRVDFNDNDSGEAGAANTETGWQSFALGDNGATYDGIRVSVLPVGAISLDARDRTTPTDSPPNLTYDQLLDDFIFAVSQTDDTGLEVLVEGLSPGQFYDLTLWSFDTGSIGSRSSTWTEVSGNAPVVIDGNYVFDGRDATTDNLSHSISTRLTASAEGTLRIRGVRNGGTSYGVFLNAIQLVAPDTSELISTDLIGVMPDQHSSVFVRHEFSVDGDAEYQDLTLKIHYDAGFVAYLNGQEIVRRNVSDQLTSPVPFDATSTTERTLDATLQAETIDLSDLTSSLQSGVNVLAIHGLNSSVGDDDFLLRAELTGISSRSNDAVYFATPSPGGPNSGETYVGRVGDTTFSQDRGFYDAPITVEVASSTPGAILVYTVDGSLPNSANGTVVMPAGPTVGPLAQIELTKTTTLRALAYKEGYLPTNVDTQTYLFLDDVIAQDPLGNPNGLTYPTRWQANATADYEMDPEVVAQWDDNNPANEDTGIREALKSIPTMSIVMNHDDLWSSSNGIYPNSDTRGERWRRAASVEYFDPQTGKEFQIDAGIQIHGGASRDNVRLKKHSFRLLFREDFGPSELNFPLYADTDNQEFNTLVLRACFTDSFATRTVTDRYNPIESQYLRDVWMKDSQLAMGNLSAHNTYVHLYINGLYWGLYDPSERPDEAFLAQYLGGEREDWDIIKDFNELFHGEKTAWNAMFSLARQLPSSVSPDAIFEQLQGNNPDGTPNPELPNYLDMDNLIDFMILHQYAGVEDWPHHNWYAGRNRVEPGKGFQFYVWDQEIALDPLFRDRTTVGTASDHRFTPAELYDLLHKNSPAFRLRFADRVQKHLFNDGALTIEASQARWMARADEIEAAIIGESARWGDAREGERIQIQSGMPTVTVPTLTVDHWRTERDRVRDLIIPRDHELLLERLKNIDILPEIAVPQFSPHGGAVSPGEALNISSLQDPILSYSELLPEFASVTAFVPRDGSLDATAPNQPPIWTTVNFDDSGWIHGKGGVGFEGSSGYESLLGIDLMDTSIPQPLRLDANGDGSPDNFSFFTRFAFSLPADFNRADVDRLTLGMKYDDGFVAYLNGTRIASANGPNVPTWNERATNSHEANANMFDEFDVSAFSNLLQPGTVNVLAIQGFNRTLTSNDLIVSPVLLAGKFLDVGSAPVYFTVDGSDPRLSNGNVNGTASLYGQPLLVTQTSTVRARSYLDGKWSALTEALFVVNPADSSRLVVSELNYNPHEPSATESQAVPGVDNDDFEFIELFNRSTTDPISLLGVQFVSGVQFTFPDVSLAPGQHGVVVKNAQAFQARYGTEVPIIGEFAGTLANGGERIALADRLGQVAIDFEYDDGALWPENADGVGGTLELIDPSGATTDLYGKPYAWQGSVSWGGSPGQANGTAIGVVVNEVLSRTTGAAANSDAIELFNRSQSPIDLSGWYLSDSRDALLKYRIPDGTILAAGQYAVFTESQFNPTPASPAPHHFALSGTSGDDVWLVIPGPDGTIASFVDQVSFGAAAQGQTLGRVPNGTGRITPLTRATLGEVNSEPQIGTVIVSEVNYHAAAPLPAALAIDPSLTRDDLEFIELYNSAAFPVSLAGWQLRGGVDFDFTTEVLAAHESLVILSFNPHNLENDSRLRAFQATYPLPPAVKFAASGFRGQLSNSTERIVLRRPDPNVDDQPEVIPYLQEDEVVYDDLAPWPTSADGQGSSLQRLSSTSFGNDPASWRSTVPSPGQTTFSTSETDFNGDGQVDIADMDLLCLGIRTGESRYDVNADGVVDRDDANYMITTVLRSVIGDTNLDGRFNSSDFVQVFLAGEYEDGIPGNSLWSEGDWNCDGDFDSSDFITAFIAGSYEAAARPAEVESTGHVAVDEVMQQMRTNDDTSSEPNDVTIEKRVRPNTLRRRLQAHDSLFARRDADWWTKQDHRPLGEHTEEF